MSRLWLTAVSVVVLVAAPASEGHLLGHDATGDDPHGQLMAGDPAQVVRRYMTEYRRTGDDALLGLGWQRLEPALAAPDVPTLMAAAWLAQAGHEFGRALGFIDRVLARRADHGEAWLLRAAILLVQGDHARARDACGEATSRVPLAVATACFARIAGAASDPVALERAYDKLAAVLAAATPREPELAGWTHGVAADLASRAARDRQAEGHFASALALAPSVAVRAGYADLLLRRGRPERVDDVLGVHAGAPALVLRELLADLRLGTVDQAYLHEVDARFRRWIAAGEFQHAREIAAFYLRVLPAPKLALEAARANWLAQREPEDRSLLCLAVRRTGVPAPDVCG